VALTKQQALDMLESDDLLGIGMEAHQMRLKKTDPRVATYQIDRNINYTNFCTEYCSFCAFYRPLGSKEGYILSFDEIYRKIEEMLELGGNGVLLQGGLHPDLQIAYLEEEPPRKEGGDPRIFSSLIDGHSEFVRDTGRRVPKFRIELPGNPILGDGKSDNQNHAIVFYRGEYLQLIDANQDNYLEECLKIRNKNL